MLFYTPHITPRIRYMVDYLNERLGLDLLLTDELELYQSHRSDKINYSAERIVADEFHMHPAGLLHQADLRKQVIECFQWKGMTAFYQTKGDDLGFDLLSAIFFLITRYEEYQESEPDEYGRYAHWNSLAWKEKFLNRPLVDWWMKEFTSILQQKFPHQKLRQSTFRFLPTYDIDIAWSYLHKGWFRSIGAMLRQPSTIVQRMAVWSRREKDPFDCYDWLQEFHQQYNLHPIYFFLLAEQQSELDKNISPRKQALKELVRSLQQVADVGIHPSVISNTAREYFYREKNQLQLMIQQPVQKSRHHYLRFHLPHSYRELIKAGISEDYSMGYGTVNGFRASTSHSYLWYDLEKEQSTILRIHPFAYMEANSFYELHQQPAEALSELHQLSKEVEEVGGTLITIFHNHFLGTDAMFRGWKEMYIQFTEEITARFSNP